MKCLIGSEEDLEDIRHKAKKDVIDDVDNLEFTNIIRQNISANQIMDEIKMYLIEQLKKRHLSTFQKKSDIIADKQNPQIDDKSCKICHKKLTEHSSFYDNHKYKSVD